MNLKSDFIAVLISIYFVALGVTYSAVTPPFEGPDELAHFVYAHNIAQDAALPVIPDRATAFETRNYEVHQLPLYYLAASPLVALFERDNLTDYFRSNPFASIGSVTGTNTNIQLHPTETDGDTLAALWAVRLLSLSFGLGTLWCVYHSGRIVWDDGVGLTAMFLAASVPTFIHISASANNDNLNAVLSSVVVVLALRAWTEKRLTPLNAALTGAALAGAAITKLTGLAAYSFAVGMAMLGAFTSRWGWGRTARYIGIVAALGVVLAGWWYVRSVMVYGDPLAYDAARALWGRSIEAPSGFELWGVWESFWMTLGHLNIPGPAWLSPYVSAMTILALVGVALRFVREADSRWKLAFLLAVTVAVAGTMIYVTRRMNISQGRALFPAMAAIAPLLVIGWRALLGRRLYWIPALPVSVVAVTAPFLALSSAFTPLVSAAPPSELIGLDARAEEITVHGYTLLTETVEPGGEVELDLYFSGSHPDNPALFVTARDPLTEARLGKVDTYPGMAPTDLLALDGSYRARVRFRLDDAPSVERPLQVQLAFGWRVPDEDDPGQGRFVQWYDSEDNEIGAVFGGGPVFVDPAYATPEVVNPVDVMFGDGIALRGYEVMETDEAVEVVLWWERAAPMAQDWTLTVGVAGDAGDMLLQQDAPVPGYPTSAWVDAGLFTTAHTLQKENTRPLSQSGEHRLRVGWYSLASGRLPVSASDAVTQRDNLVYLPLE